MTPALALQDALYNLRKRGWRQGSHGNRQYGPVDIIGAIDQDHIGMCRPYIKAAIQRQYGTEWNVTGWQDAKGRTYQEVEQIMLAAITDAERAAA
jgi:hypothetical protein